jgi:carboxylesterase
VDPLVAPLGEAGLPCRFPILRGHGTVWQDLEGVKAGDWYEDAENAFLDLLKEVESVLVVGLSMGGLVALELAARHRKETAGVVAVAAALRFADPLAPMAPALSMFIKSWPSPEAYHDKSCRDRENRNYPKFPTKTFGELLAYSRRVPDLLSFVKAPILILHSHKDQVISPASADLIHRKVSSKDRSIVWFDRSGHEMFLDLEADLVIKEVTRFVRKIAG